MDSVKVYLSNNNIREIIGDRQIFVFGTGNAAELFMHRYGGSVRVRAFVDNNRVKQNTFFYEKPIISVNELKRIRNDEVIIVTSLYGVKDISNQLEDCGYIYGKDYYIWDDLCFFHKDKYVEDYIRLTKSIWGNHVNRNAKKTILVEIGFFNQITTMTYGQACISNYLADKYDASISTFITRGRHNDALSPVAREVLASSNMAGFVDQILDDELLQERDEIVESIWNGLTNWNDWESIVIYGIDFGHTITRDFMRYYMPEFDSKSSEIKKIFEQSISTIVFWYHYFREHEIKALILLDGVNAGGYIRDIAISFNVTTYALTETIQKAMYDHHTLRIYRYFRSMWNSLSDKEKSIAYEWGREHLENRINGNNTDLLNKWDRINFSFGEKSSKKNILDENDKLKVVICPHTFEEDSCQCGGNLFGDNYFRWLCHLGDLSEQTDSYDWYIKPHPASYGRDIPIIEKLVGKYKRIKLLPFNISPKQLKAEGVQYALTISGSIGHEYPYIGINVINGGVNPHETFGFTINPKSIEEYDNVILNLESMKFIPNIDEMFQFYAMNYLIYDWNKLRFSETFFWNPILAYTTLREFKGIGRDMGTWVFKEFVETMPEGWHEEVMKKMPDLINEVESWRPDVLYKTKKFIELVNNV